MAATKKRRKQRKSRKAKTGLFTSDKCQKTFKFRSSWECKYMAFLDKNDDVISWDYECLKIPYVSNTRTKKVRNYLPDFLVQHKRDGNLVVEIKPKRKLKNPTVIKKSSAAEMWCIQSGMKFVILTEIELKALNIIS